MIVNNILLTMLFVDGCKICSVTSLLRLDQEQMVMVVIQGCNSCKTIVICLQMESLFSMFCPIPLI